MNKLVMILCLLLCAAAFTAQAEEKDLVSCELSIYGGMENEDLSYVISRGETSHDISLTVRDRGRIKKYDLPWRALDDLEEYIAGYSPDTWKDLPYREEFALDAPSRSIEVTFSDGTVCAVNDDRQIYGIFRETECFLQSYLVEGAETVEMEFSSFDGGGPEYYAVLSDPEKIRIETFREYDQPYDEMATGSAYSIRMVFHGRVPGRTELVIRMSGPLVPDEEIPETVYILEVDEEFNVKLIGEKTGEQETDDMKKDTSIVDWFRSLWKGGEMTVGADITEDSIRECYYTYSTSTNPPFYQRYRFYTEDGKYYFYHETREGGGWPQTEEDITASGTVELSHEEWDDFFGLLEGGTVTKRTESLEDGNAGPWLYLYWDGDKSEYQEFTFASYDKEDTFEEFCLALKNRK